MCVGSSLLCAALNSSGPGTLRQDVEAERQIRRYVALRTCTPNLRKTNKPGRKASTAAGADDASATESPEPSISPEEKKSGVVLKEGKEVAGFIIAEHEVRSSLRSLLRRN